MADEPERPYPGSWESNFEGESIHGWTPFNSTSLKYENLRQVKSGQGLVLNWYAYSSDAAAQFILLIDKADRPAAGDVPFLVVPVASTNYASGNFPPRGRRFTNGLWIANSSTGPTYTAGAADTWFDVQYL